MADLTDRILRALSAEGIDVRDVVFEMQKAPGLFNQWQSLSIRGAVRSAIEKRDLLRVATHQAGTGCEVVESLTVRSGVPSSVD